MVVIWRWQTNHPGTNKCKYFGHCVQLICINTFQPDQVLQGLSVSHFNTMIEALQSTYSLLCPPVPQILITLTASPNALCESLLHSSEKIRYALYNVFFHRNNKEQQCKENVVQSKADLKISDKYLKITDISKKDGT